MVLSIENKEVVLAGCKGGADATGIQPVKSKLCLEAPRHGAETDRGCSSIGEAITWTGSRFGDDSTRG